MVSSENLGMTKNFFLVRISSRLRSYPEEFLGTCKKRRRYGHYPYISSKHRQEGKCFTRLVLLTDVSLYHLMVGLYLFCLGDTLVEGRQ